MLTDARCSQIQPGALLVYANRHGSTLTLVEARAHESGRAKLVPNGDKLLVTRLREAVWGNPMRAVHKQRDVWVDPRRVIVLNPHAPERSPADVLEACGLLSD